jgi:hypothetical protein
VQNSTAGKRRDGSPAGRRGEHRAQRHAAARSSSTSTCCDDLGKRHDGVLALCVLLHVTRDATDAVLARIAAALAPGGFFLVSVREDGYARATAWTRDDFSSNASPLMGAGHRRVCALRAPCPLACGA